MRRLEVWRLVRAALFALSGTIVIMLVVWLIMQLAPHTTP